MRVLIINTSERIGGAAVAASRLMESLKNNGIKAKMLVRDKQTNQISVVRLERNWLTVWKFMWERIVIWKANHFRKNKYQSRERKNCMFNVTCLIKTDIDTVNKCMGQNPYNPETFLQNFASRLTSFDDPLLNIYPTSEIAGNIEDEDVILGLREPQKLIEWAKTMKERTQCMAMAEFSAALQKHKAEGIDITKPMYTCLRSIEMDSNESYPLR